MFTVKVKSNLRAQAIAKLNKVVDDQFVARIQNEVVDGEIKRMIAAGTSPVQSVEGGRRFAGYKNPDKYPAKKKAKRPVSLYLSGLMMSWYKAVRVSGRTIQMGIPSDAPMEVKDRAQANNEGTVNEKGEIAIAARRFIPLKGETFAVSVLRKMKNLYSERIKTLLSSK